MANQGFVPVMQFSRGGLVESIHFGAAAIVDVHGRLLGAVGDPRLRTFMRSTAKPFQALPFAEHGGPQHFNLTPREIALTCASHNGTDEHASTAAAIQEKVGIAESELQCGTHLPIDKATRLRMELAGEEPSPNRHNCSGKHTGMLAFALMMNWPTETYLDVHHPLQQLVLRTLAEMAELPAEAITIGTDGCSAPNFALPLYNAAWAYAKLVDSKDLAPARAQACQVLTSAMQRHPIMIGGPGAFDSRLMEVGRGRLICKGGAEGYHGVGVLPGVLGKDSPGVGIACKISDGAFRSLADTGFVLEILRLLGALDEDQLSELEDFGPRKVLTNYRHLEVGTAEPCFDLSSTA